VIDTVAFVWGVATPVSTFVDEPRGRARRRSIVHDSPPVYLEWPDLLDRLGSPNGEVRRMRYGDRVVDVGHWKVGDHELLYTDGRVELRASLPKLLVGSNIAVLDEAGVHDAMRELVRVGSETAGATLALETMVPSRLDYCVNWELISVDWALEHLKASMPSRAKFDETISRRGGHTLYWGKGSKRVLRWYDKGAEALDAAIKSGEVTWTKGHRLNCRCEQCGPAPFPIDTILRFEIQERRRGQLRRVHERGYRAADVREELQRTIGKLADLQMYDLRELASTRPPMTVGVYIRSQWLRDNPAAWKILREHFPASTYHRWRQQSREKLLGSAGWTPHVADDAFESAASNLWRDQAAA
jgi:hypothetical protein